MKRIGAMVLAGVSLAMLSGSIAFADVKSEEKAQVKFEGALGRMFNMFGGRAAREGLVTKVAIKGDRKFSQTGDVGEIVDLGEEKIYTLDFKHQSYTVTTFDEMRRRMREAQEKAREQDARREEKDEKQKPDQQAPEYEIDVSTKPTGQTKALNGFDTREVVTTITVRQKGKTIDQGGGMVLTSDSWLAPKIAAMNDRADFEMRYWKQLQGAGGPQVSAEQMAAALAMYPMLKQALDRVHTEGQQVEGTPIQTVLTVEAVKSPEQMQEQEKSDEDSGGGGGLGGMLARKMMKRKQQQDDAAAAGPKNHATVMTMTNEVLSVSNDVGANDVALPAGFKQKD
jgi:hypothetical protein